MTAAKTSHFRFFLPNARLLEKHEIEKLPSVKSGDQEGLWLEIACPDEACIDENGNITIPAKDTDTTEEKKGFLLNLFCPEDSCEVVQSTDLP